MLDPTTKKEWKLKVIQKKENPLSTTNQLMEFLNTWCEFLEALQSIHIKIPPTKISTQKLNQANVNKS